MLGHVYVVEDAKDLAQIVRDVTRYGGAYRPEVMAPVDCPSQQLNFFYRIYTSLSNGGQIGNGLKRL
jgi:recyclin-1